MSLKDYIQENIVKPQIDSYQRQTKATVMIINEKRNRCTISFKDKLSGPLLINVILREAEVTTTVTTLL